MYNKLKLGRFRIYTRTLRVEVKFNKGSVTLSGEGVVRENY